MSIAEQVATRATCDRAQVGVVIVRPDNTICSTGYNGSARGQAHCDDVGHLMQDGHCVRALHAEGNALDWAQECLSGYTLYTTHRPCRHCAQRIVNRGISRVVYGQDYGDGDDVVQMLRYASVDLVKCEVAPGPVLLICQDGDAYFAVLPDFADLQESPVVWLKTEIIDNLLAEFNGDDATGELTSEEKTARFEKARADGAMVVDQFGRKNWEIKGDWGE